MTKMSQNHSKYTTLVENVPFGTTTSVNIMITKCIPRTQSEIQKQLKIFQYLNNVLRLNYTS